jgi:hypothetical protein
MAGETSYRKWLEQDMGELIDALDLLDLQKHFLRSRWLGQVLWMEDASDRSRIRYYILRVTTIAGGVFLPALVSLNVSGQAASFIRWFTFGLSLLVAISAALEEVFHFGEHWRHYRRTVELLKIEGWQFFQLSGPYRRYKQNHAGAYPAFAARVEDIIRREVEVYITEVVREKEEKEEEQETP